MKFSQFNHILTLFWDGPISSETIDQIRQDSERLISEQPHNALIIDMQKVDYISSVGLRLLLKFIKSEKNFEIINVSPSVYDIFNITGFLTMTKIQQAKRWIDLTDAELIGSGFFSKVYRLAKDTIIKVYYKGTALEEIERERELAKQAFIMGVPCAIPFDIANTEYGYGLVFEAINSGTLTETLKTADESDVDQLLVEYAQFLKRINTTDAGVSSLPNANELAMKKLDFIQQYLTIEQYQQARILLEQLVSPNTFVHSDCHTGNIMRHQNEWMIIDMDTLSVGNPIFELAAIFCCYCAFDDSDPGNTLEFFGLERSFTDRIFTQTLQVYFEGKSDDTIQRNLIKIKLAGYLHMLYWLKKYKPEDNNTFAYHYSKFCEYLPLVTSLNLE